LRPGDHFEVTFLVGQRTASDPDRVVGRLHGSDARHVIERQLVESQRESDLLRFAGSQRHALKSLQAAHRLLNAGAQIAHVALHHLGRRAVPSIGHGRGRFNQSGAAIRNRLCKRNAGSGDLDVAVGEAGIRQAEAKREKRAVGHIDVAGEEARVPAGRVR